MTADHPAVTPPPDNGVWGTIDGRPITDADIDEMVADAEAGFPTATPRLVGRPCTIGGKRAETVTVRLDPDRLDALRSRADHDHSTTSEILRRALDHYLAS